MFEGGGLATGCRGCSPPCSRARWPARPLAVAAHAGARRDAGRALGLILAALVSGLDPRLLTALGRAGLGHRARARGAERRHAPLPRRGPVAGHHAAARRRAARHRRRAALLVAARRLARLPVLRARRAADPRGHPDHRDRDAALALARRRDRRADGLLPVARAAAAAAGHRGRGAGRDRARRRAAAEPGDRPRRPVVRLPRVRRGARHAGVGALQLGAHLRPDHVAARRARDAADQDDASRSTGSSRTSRTSTASAGSMRGVPDPYGPGPRPTSSRAGAPARSGPARPRHRARPAGRRLRRRRHDALRRRRRPRGETFSPGTWQADKELKAGDSYRIRFHAPRPNALELSAASSGSRGQQGDALQITLPLLSPSCPTRTTRARGRSPRSSSSCGRSTSSARRSPRTSAAARPSPGSRRCATRPTGAPGSSPRSSSAARARRTSSSAASTPT